MPLGLAKDSMINLAELASTKVEEKQKEEIETFHIKNGNKNNALTLSYEIAEATTNEKTEREEAHRSEKEETVVVMPETAPEKETLWSDSVSTSPSTIISNISSDNHDRAPPSSSLVNEDNNIGQQPQPQQYAGFSSDYNEYENYAFHSSYSFDADSVAVSRQPESSLSWLSCLFPWCPIGANLAEEDEDERFDADTHGLSNNDSHVKASESRLSKSNETANSDLSPISTENDSSSTSSHNNNTFSNGKQVKKTGMNRNGEKKGIMKRSSTLSQSTRSSLSNGSGVNGLNGARSERRSLFPSYEEKKPIKKDLHLNFSPMARVVTIKSLKDMDNEERSGVWWQKADYDEFRKTGRMVSKVMLQGGSEIWLATNRSWQLPNQGKAATLKTAMEKIDSEDKDDKWWHKFGHSRRGLEHIASLDEGRQRQANVKTSIAAVLTEQRRQKAFHREDQEKLRMVSIQNTSWAKDLALASGASDADAVLMDFDDVNRKSREFYLLKFSRANQSNDYQKPSNRNKQVIPAFMKPAVSLQLQQNRLDANTMSRLKFRQKEERAAISKHQRRISDLAGQVLRAPSIREPIHSFDGPVEKSLAHKAAGFANGEETINMSKVLTGTYIPV